MANSTRRYRLFKANILKTRGKICECCHVYAKHLHHIIPVQETGIHAELVFEPANIMILCDDCHCLMHPARRYPWLTLRIVRSHALAR